MFLKCEPNPHHGGRMTRAVFFEHVPGQRFAIDAETLHKQPELLNAFGRHMNLRFKLLDTVAYMMLLIGVIGSMSVAWYLFIPGLATCLLMLMANRLTAGDVARQAAKRSVDSFRHLHEMGCLWLVRA